MDYNGTLNVELELHRSIVMHTLAAKFFQVRQFWFFEFTAGFLTMLSSILAFIATTELVVQRDQIVLTTVVGATTVVVGFLQALNSNLGYGTRAVMHQSVAIDLRDLRNHLRMIRCQLGFAEQHGLQGVFRFENDEEEEFTEGTFESIRDKFEQSLNGCKSPLPIEISEAFSGIESSMHTTGVQSTMELFIRLYGPKFHWQFLFFKYLDIASELITDHRYFPFFLPRSSSVIKKAKVLIKQEFKEGREFYSESP